ncbi:ATP-binding protein [Halobacillus halophilus]|jgi:OmpR family two-component system bacitracin resistance sensor histidine kinase BceS|uniref:histidine kinase n=1 Tax=Halobacillus halophilus (strain ATCC 35676 / DSM 2266 / JCM 20832 / KCTC 3685 / LMG 17431 / NBRC 102448 / NCIMB 2269) TaxID=866895 RepID=I0JT85_HALH3|nr:sensor histidine kinase [Halobacillus halophilus]ASF41274.1 ATP-binding protein [Halobacillus halophilus]CCG47357.1 two-component sensor histidine kinase [Halobacillus halophilus DSM 2266]
MIRKFLLEKISWIGFFLILQLLALLLAYVDTNLSLSSMYYYTFLSSLLFLIFLFIRYQKETRFYREMNDRAVNLDVTTIPDAESPFEKIIETSVIDQMEQLKKESSHNHSLLEQEKDDMLAWIHEVKTPLTSMHLIFDRISDQKTRSQLTYEWLRIHLLLDQQLHKKRMPFIENDLYMEEIQLEPLIFSELKTLQSWCIQKGIGFDIDLEVASVLSDSKWLAFMLRQLLTNGVKYSEASEIMVRSFEENGQTRLAVTDTGRGIDARDLPRIFDKGFTSTMAHHDHGATGMGLYLTHKAADSLNINIEVDSKLGEGTTFTLIFPKRNDFVEIRDL